MDTCDKKRLFKTKVIAKLFGQTDEDDNLEDQTSDSNEGDATDTTRTSPGLSELQAPGTKVYGCPTEENQENSCQINVCDPYSISPVSDNDDSESFLARKKRKRRGQHGCSKSEKKQQNSTLSSNDSTQNNESSCSTNSPSPLTGSSLTKNQKRKLKKKRKKKEKKEAQTSSCVEFTFNSYTSST